MIKYVIFDFDGTLVDSGEIAFKIMNIMAKKHNFKKMDWNEIEIMRKMPVNERFKYMKMPMIKVPFYAAEYYSLYKEALPDLNMNRGVEGLIEQLNEFGMKIAVISSNSEYNIRIFLKSKKINYIKDILCSHHLFEKDKIISKFLKRHKLKKDEVIYIGDELRDIKACKKAGIKIIWVDWGLDLFATIEPANPDYTVSFADEIYEIIKKMEK